MNAMTVTLAAALTLAAGGAIAQTPAASFKPSDPASTSMTCKPQLDDLYKTWSADLPFTPEKPGQANVQGRHGHAHAGIDYSYMNRQLRLAGEDCKAGREHEAMLRMDTVRTIMKFPEVAHPASHNYHPAKS